MMVIENKYDIGQTVYLLTDRDQQPRLVTSLQVFKGNISYVLCKGSEMSSHYDFEISDSQNELIKL